MNKRWQVVLIWLGGIVILGLIMFIGMKNSIDRKISEELANEKKNDRIDVEEYYRQNGKLLDKCRVNESDDVQNEIQAIEAFKVRGFAEFPIYSDYLMNGEYTGEIEVSGTNEKHPSYQTSYVSSSGELWTIIMMNGSIIANPVSYNMNSNLGVQTVIAESDIIMGYDSETNMFYKIRINKSELIVKVIEKIDAQTLDKLTEERINEL